MPALDFRSDRPKVLTYHAAKGLTFDSVLLPRLASRSFPRSEGSQARNVLFVGITRATHWVYLSAVRGRELPLLRETGLTSGGAELEVQLSRKAPGLFDPVEPAEPDAERDDGDDAFSSLL